VQQTSQLVDKYISARQIQLILAMVPGLTIARYSGLQPNQLKVNFLASHDKRYFAKNMYSLIGYFMSSIIQKTDDD
jgi:hypothetical protein